jgi:peptidoglycan/xylan/chitin deacetylase (PgdA/CDA1 family)
MFKGIPTRKLILGYTLISILVIPLGAVAREIALTFDDAPTPDSVLMTGAERTAKLITALQQADVRDAVFYIKADDINPQKIISD